MTDGSRGQDVERSRRPAERQLVSQLQQERQRLLDGFDSRKAVLRWCQRICVRSLGTIPQRRFNQLADSFVPDEDALEGPLLASFLTEEARTRVISPEAASGLSERWASEVLGSVQVDAFRDLRKDAGEYVGESEEGEHGAVAGFDPDAQAFAMRPALKELDAAQREALDMALGGLPDRSAILDWGDKLVTATRGEPVDEDRGAGAFIPKCYREPSTVRLLTDESEPYKRAREAFLAYWVLPAFNRGVRDLTGRTAEEPQLDNHDGMPEPPSW